VNVILRDIDEGREEYNAEWDQWVAPRNLPVRITCLGCMHPCLQDF
jgi:hypothetical protein